MIDPRKIFFVLLIVVLAACSQPIPLTPQIERAADIPTPPMIDPTPTKTPTRLASPSVAATLKPVATPTPIHAVTIDAAPLTATITPSISLYTAFDFLRDYLTNKTYSTIIDGTLRAWTNNSVNVDQYAQPLGGVSYWDFWSELENWDSPFFMYQDDNGTWLPYGYDTVRDATGKAYKAYLLADRQGPGVMDKLWFTQDAVWMLATEESRKNVGPIADLNLFNEWGNLDKLGILRIEVDDKIAYDGAIIDWISGKALGLTPELAQILTWRHREYGSNGSIVPIPYQKHLRVLLYNGSKKPKWFMASGTRFSDATRVKPFAASDLPIAEMTRLAANVLRPENFIDTLGTLRAFDLQADATVPASIRFNGAGIVSALQISVAKKYDAKQLWLRVKYGNDVGISAPLIAFFGDQQQLVLHRSAPLGIVESTDNFIFYSNLPMPFQNGMSIEIENKSVTPIPLTVRVALSRETTRTQLWTQYRAPEKLAMYGPDYHVTITGDGKLVGLVLETLDQGLDSIPKIFDPKNPSVEDSVKRAWTMGYLEGNLHLFDGTGRERIYGGHEDWADAGFYFNRGYTSPSGGSNRPFGGILRYQDGKAGYATIFRYFNDQSAFRFQNGLQMNLGHGTWNNNFPVQFGITVYYYKEIQ